MKISPALAQLIDAFARLPSIGARTAQRLSYHLLDGHHETGQHLSDSLLNAFKRIKRCQSCRNYCENDRCEICTNEKRDRSTLCIVEKPIDLYAMEESQIFSGVYFVLHGYLSPLDGIGPEQLGILELKSLVENATLNEIVLATGTTLEGEATAQLIEDTIACYNIPLTRLAHGIPLGESLEYLDSGTLSLAFKSRSQLKP